MITYKQDSETKQKKKSFLDLSWAVSHNWSEKVLFPMIAFHPSPPPPAPPHGLSVACVSLVLMQECRQQVTRTFVRHCQRAPRNSWSPSAWWALLARVSPEQDTSWQASTARHRGSPRKSSMMKNCCSNCPWCGSAQMVQRQFSNRSWWWHCQVTCTCTYQVTQSTKCKGILQRCKRSHEKTKPNPSARFAK